MAKQDLISLLAIDEAHAVEQAGRSFRREFVDAVLAMKHLFDVMPCPVPQLAMSATFRQEDYERVVSLFGLDEAIVMQGDLSRRRTHFACYVGGTQGGSLIKQATKNLTPTNQQLFYCNSRHTCENSLLESLDKLIDKHLRSKGHQAVATSFTGGDGLKMKTALMDAFTNSSQLPGEPAIHTDGTATLPKIALLAATSAANCGISSNELTHVHHKGFPYNMYDVVQEMGRANRTQKLDNCSYSVYVSFSCLLTSYVRIMASPNAQERRRLTRDLLEVVSFLLVPEMCYHSFIELYFEWETTAKQPCVNKCSYCTGACAAFTGSMKKGAIQNVLCEAILQNRNATPDSLKKAITQAKADIFHTVPKSAAPIHALLLQLYASKIVCFEIRDNTIVGTDKVQFKGLGCRLFHRKGRQTMGILKETAYERDLF
ncbi:hypothetical protein ACHAWO_005411 [Cyclotella atomus]|uniref:DNA 3'-5' helicase n=1 Tax=Cyclotella atomus TaxID=382360 RepID=A0ABD3Q0J8_9STRA